MSGAEPMHRFVERLAAAGGVDGAKRRRRQHAQRPGQHGGHVGQQVPEQIVGDDDVELFRISDQLHSAIVGQDVAEFDIVITAGLVDFGDRLTPEDPGLHDIGLFRRRDFLVALAGEIEGDFGDPDDFVAGIGLGVDAALLTFPGLHAARFAEIDPGGQLAHDHNVQAAYDFGFQGGGVEARRR